MAPRHGACPGAIPRNRTNFLTSRAPARAAESPKLSLPGAAPGRLANFTRGRGRKVMHLPCKQAQAGALPAVLHHFALRGESDSGEPHKLSLSGCNSRPRYQFREVIQLPDCKSGVAKQNWK